MILKANQRNIERATAINGRIKVFVYGSLKRAITEPVCVTGALYLRPQGTAAADFGDPTGSKVWGDIIEVTPAKLLELDRREGATAPIPWYTRILVKARNGEVCWAYQWDRDFDFFQHVPSGVWKWEHLRTWRPRYAHDLKVYQLNLAKNPTYLKFLN